MSGATAIAIAFVRLLVAFAILPAPFVRICCHVDYPSSSPPWLPPVPPPPWFSPPSVMSSSPDAAAAAVGSTFCQLTSSANWRLNLAATVQPSRLLPLAAFSISAVATFRVPRPSGDGYRSALPLATEGTQESRLTSLTFLTLGIVETSFTLLSLTRKVGGIAQTSNASVPFGMGTA